MPTIGQILQEKKVNFCMFVGQILAKQSNTRLSDYYEKLIKASIEEFLVYIKTFLVPKKDRIHDYIIQLELQYDMKLCTDDFVKMSRYLELFILLSES